MSGDIGREIFGIIFFTVAFFVIVNFIEIAKHNYKHNKEIKRKKENDGRTKPST